MARLLARWTGSELHLVHVLASPPVDAFHPEQKLSMEERMRDRARSYLERKAREDEEKAPEVKVAVLGGSVADAIQSYAGRVRAGWVVLTSHGSGGLTRFWTGSVADGLLRSLHVPLLVLRPWDHTGELAPGEAVLERILVPLDGSGTAEAALPAAVTMARTFEAGITLVTAVPALAGEGSDEVVVRPGNAAEEREEEALAYLESVADRLWADGVKVDRVLARNRTTSGAILAAASLLASDLVVLATHGRGGLERVVVGSVGDEIMRESALPVLLVPVPEGE